MGPGASNATTSAKFVSSINGKGVPKMKKQFGIGNGHLELPLRGKKHYIVFVLAFLVHYSALFGILMIEKTTMIVIS
jgi:hypothetical protein